VPFQLFEAKASNGGTVSVAASSEVLMRRNKLERHEMSDDENQPEKLPRRSFLKAGASLGAASLLPWRRLKPAQQ